jgi:hypothetical protein
LIIGCSEGNIINFNISGGNYKKHTVTILFESQVQPFAFAGKQVLWTFLRRRLPLPILNQETL